MKQFLKTIAIYGFGIFIVLNLLAFLCLYFLNNSSFYKQQFVKNNVEDTRFDYVILGSSTGLTTLDSKQIDSISGLNGLNISMDDSGLSAHYLMLQQFYAYGHQTKNLILCVMPDDLTNENPTINGNDYRFLPNGNDKEVKYYFNEMEGKNKWIYQLTPYIPLVGVSYFNTELFYPGIIAGFQPQKRNLFDEKGNYSYPVNQSASKRLLENKKMIKKVDIQNPYFTKIVDFCANNQINLIFYQSPIYNTKISLETSMPFINHSALLEEANLFYDKIHVNRNGRVICSQEIGTFLSNKYK